MNASDAAKEDAMRPMPAARHAAAQAIIAFPAVEPRNCLRATRYLSLASTANFTAFGASPDGEGRPSGWVWSSFGLAVSFRGDEAGERLTGLGDVSGAVDRDPASWTRDAAQAHTTKQRSPEDLPEARLASPTIANRAATTSQAVLFALLLIAISFLALLSGYCSGCGFSVQRPPTFVFPQVEPYFRRGQAKARFARGPRGLRP